MEYKAHIKTDLSGKKRVICVSDMHGYMDLFLRLMDKIALTDDDALIVIGDFSNKGIFSCEMAEYVYELNKRDNVYVLAGNGEYYNTLSYKTDRGWLLRYAPKWPGCLFTTWAERLGFSEITAENLDTVCDAIDEKYGFMIDWLHNLPLYLESGDKIFVHSGMSEIPADPRVCIDTLLKDGEYLTSGENNTGKWVIVGHWPVYNCGNGYSTNGILVNEARKIIGIDGGISTKRFCRMNALIFENGGMSCEYVHDFPVHEVCCDVEGDNSTAPMQFTWPNFAAEILQPGEHFTLCKNVATGQIGLVKNEHIKKSENGHKVAGDSNSCFLSVKKGDKIAIGDGNCSGYAYVMTESGALGFVPKSAIGKLINDIY